MYVLISINHPAQYHLFKNVYDRLFDNGDNVTFVIKEKDILEKLLISDNRNFIKLTKKRIGKNKFSILTKGLIDLIIQDFYLLKYCLSNKPDILIGTDYCITHVGKLLNIPSIVFNEDDYDINKFFCRLSYPFCNLIISPKVCDVGKYYNKKISYEGFQKLSYLHPNIFSPDIKIFEKYREIKSPFVLIRLVRFSAGHDIEQSHSGITLNILDEVIKTIKLNKRNVYITSESKIPSLFDEYQLKIDPKDIHHILSYADLLIADSQSMIVEASMLGTPSLRFNSFVGQISVLNELEQKYKLTIGVLVNNSELLLDTLRNILKEKEIKQTYKERKEIMLRDKIDLTSFIFWFVINYPKSEAIMRENPNYQLNFK